VAQVVRVLPSVQTPVPAKKKKKRKQERQAFILLFVNLWVPVRSHLFSKKTVSKFPV
jgi:hypothetical protein